MIWYDKNDIMIMIKRQEVGGRLIFLLFIQNSQKEESGVKSIERFALSLEGIHHIHSSDCLPLGMVSVGDGIPQEIMQKVPQHVAGLVIHQSRDALNTATTSQTTNRRL